jgi:hypothetical protein
VFADGLKEGESLLRDSLSSIDGSLLQTISASPLLDHGDLEGEDLDLGDETSVEDTMMTTENVDDQVFLQEYGDSDLLEVDIEDIGLSRYDTHSVDFDADDLDMLEVELFDEILEDASVVAFIQQKRLSASSEDECEFEIEAKRAKLVI